MEHEKNTTLDSVESTISTQAIEAMGREADLIYEDEFALNIKDNIAELRMEEGELSLELRGSVTMFEDGSFYVTRGSVFTKPFQNIIGCEQKVFRQFIRWCRDGDVRFVVQEDGVRFWFDNSIAWNRYKNGK